MFESVLVANRGEIARRIIRTACRLGVRSVAVYSDADEQLPFVAEADEAVRIGPAQPAQSYLDLRAILAAAQRSGAQAIHPGYGFLAEDPAFAEAVLAAGIVWVGPSARAMALMADKINARNLMERAGVPVATGSREPLADVSAALVVAGKIGYPVMVKPSAGGGGIGMTAARDPAELEAAFATATSRAGRFFGSGSVLLERLVERARHVEVQLLGLADGRVLALGERDCSVQRRHQKIAEETPSPGLDGGVRAALLAAGVRAGEAVGYRGAGTVEFLVDAATSEFMFLEMNTRLQVEHPVTELVTGIDLVEQQFRIAAGEDVSFTPELVRSTGHALELRICAEDSKRFLPSPGTITQWSEPSGPGIRVDAGYAAGNTVTPWYDPLLAKLCVRGSDREQALDLAAAAVANFGVTGVRTNLEFHADLLASAEYRSGDYDTGVVARLRP